MPRCGDFPPLPAFVRRYSQRDVAQQTIPWEATDLWSTAFAGHASLLADLQTEVRDRGGIRREFVFAHATDHPVALFLLTMAWGFGDTNVRWPGQRAMLTPPFQGSAMAHIVRQVQKNGAGAGWSALWGANHVQGLGAAFGTKLLYFAGYKNCPNRPKPLVLDANVRKALNDTATGLSTKIGYWRTDYERYSNLLRTGPRIPRGMGVRPLWSSHCSNGARIWLGPSESRIVDPDRRPASANTQAKLEEPRMIEFRTKEDWPAVTAKIRRTD